MKKFLIDVGAVFFWILAIRLTAECAMDEAFNTWKSILGGAALGIALSFTRSSFQA